MGAAQVSRANIVMRAVHDLARRYIEYHAHAQRKIWAAAVIGVFGFPIFYLAWTYVLPQPYDSLTLRGIGTVLCLALGAGALVAGGVATLHRAVLLLHVSLLPAVLLHADAAAQRQQCHVADVDPRRADLRGAAVRPRQRHRRAGRRLARGDRRLSADDRRRAHPGRVLDDAADTRSSR